MQTDNIITIHSFSVIGIEGCSSDDPDVVKHCWKELNSRLVELQPLMKTDEQGHPSGFWGAMSDMGMNYLPWTGNYRIGRYLAAVEVKADATAPTGFVQWTLPSFRCLSI